MTPPELGKTAFEVVTALQPTLDKMASKDGLEALTREVGRLANEFGRMNGTLRDVCIWQGKVDERHRQEDKHAEAAAKTPDADAAPNAVWKRTVTTALYSTVILIIGVAVGMGILFVIGYDQIIAAIK